MLDLTLLSLLRKTKVYSKIIYLKGLNVAISYKDFYKKEWLL